MKYDEAFEGQPLHEVSTKQTKGRDEMIEAVRIPDQGITDAEMWASVDEYLCQKKALELLKEACPSIFLTNRARLAAANIFAPFIKQALDRNQALLASIRKAAEGMPNVSVYDQEQVNKKCVLLLIDELGGGKDERD